VILTIEKGSVWNMERGTSNIPLITGIIGAVLMLPAMLCSVMCAVAGAGFMAEGISPLILILGVLPIVFGIVGGIKGRSDPLLSMIFLLAAAVIALIGWVLSMFTDLFHLGALILFIVGGIMAKVQKME
jgi:hypothetical protein